MCTTTDFSGIRRLSGETRETVSGSLRERGLRLTPQRQAVCEAIFNCPGHICAEHILESVSSRYPRLRMNKTTVYRTLDLLLELSLLSEHRCADGRAQYEPASRGHHSHAICRKCGTLVEIGQELLDEFSAGLRSRHGFRADLESYPIFGVCSACDS